VDKITDVMPAPDFPTGAKVIGLEYAKEAYATGRGTVLMQSVYHITKGDKGKTQNVFTEFPYGTAPNDVISALKENEKKYLTSVRAIKDNNGRGKVERSEERRVGKECRYQRDQAHETKKNKNRKIK